MHQRPVDTTILGIWTTGYTVLGALYAFATNATFQVPGAAQCAGHVLNSHAKDTHIEMTPNSTGHCTRGGCSAGLPAICT